MKKLYVFLCLCLCVSFGSGCGEVDVNFPATENGNPVRCNQELCPDGDPCPCVPLKESTESKAKPTGETAVPPPGESEAGLPKAEKPICDGVESCAMMCMNKYSCCAQEGICLDVYSSCSLIDAEVPDVCTSRAACDTLGESACQEDPRCQLHVTGCTKKP